MCIHWEARPAQTIHNVAKAQMGFVWVASVAMQTTPIPQIVAFATMEIQYGSTMLCRAIWKAVLMRKRLVWTRYQTVQTL